MTKFILFVFLLCTGFALHAQDYPAPEFSNEVYYLKKDSIKTATRLEKNSSKLETKTKLGAFEYGYTIEGEKSWVRLSPGTNLSFIFSTEPADKNFNALTDSVIKASGVDPSLMPGMSNSNDPATSITFYKVESAKGQRKIYLQKSNGLKTFTSKKGSASDIYTFSVKKIKEGYWELVIDKPLPKGEYAFTSMQGAGMGSMGAGTILFAFGID